MCFRGWFAVGLLVLITAPLAAGEPVVVTADDEGYWFTAGGEKVLYYQRQTKSQDGKFPRANYIHPLFGLDGQLLTEDFPADHPHHRGVFWGWHQLHVGDKHAGDGWACQAFHWDVRKVELPPRTGGSAALEAQVIWSSPEVASEGEPLPLVEENTLLTVYPVDGDHRLIDFDIRLKALQPDLRIGGSDNQKGYGGFSVRVQLPKDIRFVSSNGELTPQTTAVKGGPWLDMTGHLGGADQVSGVSILCDPQAPAVEQPWILRSQRSMQNPAFPGREPVALSQETPLRLRYRLVIHRGTATAKQLEAWQKDFIEAR